MSKHSNIILKRDVFWSMLESALPIPLESQKIYAAITGHPLDVGKKHDIKLIIDGMEFDAYFRNVAFNRNTFDHSDIVMLSYGVEVKRKLKELFSDSYKRMLEMRDEVRKNQKTTGTKGRITIGNLDGIKEYVILKSTSEPDVFVLDCITSDVTLAASEEIHKIDEEIYENASFESLIDKNAEIKYSNALHKIRKLDRSIAESLKYLYDFRCQMTGERIGDKQNGLCVEAHHIIPFTESLNNDYSNIIILSPNYHRIIHKAKPEFDSKNLAFVYPNGLVEKIKLNKHL